MKSPKTVFLILISLLVIAGRSSARSVMKNSMFILPGNPSAFDSNLNSFFGKDSTFHTGNSQVEKDVMDCDEEISPWRISSAKGANNENKESFMLSPIVQESKKSQSTPTSADKAEGLYSLLPKGTVTPSGPSPKVNSKLTERRLSTSSNSPGVGHMQIIRPKSQTLNGHTLKYHDSHGDDHVQQEKGNTRKLGSTPSPGVGN